MKKLLLFSLLDIFMFTACEQQTVKKSDLPIEVVKLKETQKFDTILSINTDKKVYLFDKQSEYKGAYHVTNNDSMLFYFGLVFGFLFGIVLGKIVD